MFVSPKRAFRLLAGGAAAALLLTLGTQPAAAQMPYNFHYDAYGIEFFEDEYLQDERYERQWLRYDDNWDDFEIEEYDEYVEDTQDDWGEEPIAQDRFDDLDSFEEWDNEESFEESYDRDRMVYDRDGFDIRDHDTERGVMDDQGFGLDDDEYYEESYPSEADALLDSDLEFEIDPDTRGLNIKSIERESEPGLDRDVDVDIETEVEDGGLLQDSSSIFDRDGPDSFEEMDDADSYEEYGYADLMEDYDAPSVYYDATDGDSEFIPGYYGYPYSKLHPAAPLFLEDTPDVELDTYYTEDWYEEDPDFDYWYGDAAGLEDDDDSPITTGGEIEPDIDRDVEVDLLD